MAKKETALKPSAKHARSGYARDIMPDRIEVDEKLGKTVPIGSVNGAQEGRIPPAQRKYEARYKSVDIREAMDNMVKRARGEMPPIKNGLDDLKFPEANRSNAKTVGKTKGKTEYDPLGDMPAELPDPQPGDLTAEEQSLGRTVTATQYSEPPTMRTVVSETPEQVYLKQRNRVTLEMADGSMSMSCISVIESQYGVTILLPMSNEGSIFSPKPGTSVTIVRGEKRWPAFYPGTSFEIPELSLFGLVFVKAEEQ